MRTSVHGTYKGTRGVSLVEILLVMLVIAIALAMVMPNLTKSHEQTLLEEGKRLSALLSYASDMSTSTGHAIAWEQTPAGYRFLEKDQDLNVWKPLLDDSSLRERVLPERVQIEFIPEQGKHGSQLAKVIFNPSGVQAPFEIGLHNESQHIRVIGNLIGQITLARTEY